MAETLQRDSKVVENWLDALFLQRINFKHDEEQVNEQFLVKFPEGQAPEEIDKSQGAKEQILQADESKKGIGLPKDEQLKSLFIQAKKYAYAEDFKKSMQTFKLALDRAVRVEDTDTQSKVMFEIGKIYDKTDYLAQALTSYDKSTKISQDQNVKTQAHYSMAQIYDDVSEFEAAIEHYMSSVSFAGETENLSAQSASLTKIGNIFTDKYQREAFDFYTEAKELASQTTNSKVKGYVSSSIGNAHSKFNEPQEALKSFSDAVKEYSQSDSPAKVAINYQKAADVMVGFGNPAKAKSLMQKALINAQKSDDKELIAEINSSMKMF
jgi:tetratricopeptide (TPR) repeat protein